MPHQDFILARALFGDQGARDIVIRVYTFHNLAVVDEVRSATSDGQQRSIWACTPVAGASRFAERLAIIYAAPLPFRHCFLQRTSPPLADFAESLRRFPWLPTGLTCREATGFFDWEAHTPRLSPIFMVTLLSFNPYNASFASAGILTACTATYTTDPTIDLGPLVTGVVAPGAAAASNNNVPAAIPATSGAIRIYDTHAMAPIVAVVAAVTAFASFS